MTAWAHLLHEAALDALALLAPVDCAGCSAPDRALCPACRAHLEPSPRTARLHAAGEPSLPVVAGLAYEGVARSALLALKEEGRTELARALAPALLVAVDRGYASAAAAAAADGAGAAGAADATGALLVPVPGSLAAARRRGFHPAVLLARRAGLQPVSVLRLTDDGHGPQKSRRLNERVAETRPITARCRLDGRTVIVLDDVVTSGATLLAAAAALRAAGAVVAGAVALAATPRRFGVAAVEWRITGVEPEPSPARAPSRFRRDAGAMQMGEPLTFRLHED